MRSPFAVLAAGVAWLVSCVSAPGVDARALVAAGAPVVDVRNQDEWSAGHLEGSTLVPLPRFAASLKEVAALVNGDKTRPVIVVCRSGSRSEQARSILLANGFTNVINAGAWNSLR